MKRGKLEKHLRDQGCRFLYHGGNHDIWLNPENGQQSPIPRHSDVAKFTARGICKQLGVAIPPGS